MRLPREVEAILRADMWNNMRPWTFEVAEAGHNALADWLFEENIVAWNGGDVALSLLMSEHAGGEL